MRRVVNVRATVLAAASETAVILILALGGKSVGAALIIGLFMLAAYIIAGVVSVKTSKKKLLAALVFAFVLSVVTTATYTIRLFSYNSFVPDANAQYEVDGEIDAVVSKQGTVESLTLTAVKIDGKKTNGKVQVFFEEDDVPADSLPLGASFSVRGKLRAVELVSDAEINGSAYRKNTCSRART